MQNTMKNDPVKLIIKGSALGFGVLFYPVNADVDLGFTFTKLKGYNVSVVIMLQIATIDIKQELIGTKNNVECGNGGLVLFKSSADHIAEPVALA